MAYRPAILKVATHPARVSNGLLSGRSPLYIYSHQCYFAPMPTSLVIKNDDFQLISEFAQPDAKKRLSLGEALSGVTALTSTGIASANSFSIR